MKSKALYESARKDREKVYIALASLWKRKLEPVTIPEIEGATGLLGLRQVWNALMFLRKRAVAIKNPSRKGGWLPGRLPKTGICWLHGTALYQLDNETAFCPTCETEKIKRGDY